MLVTVFSLVLLVVQVQPTVGACANPSATTSICCDSVSFFFCFAPRAKTECPSTCGGSGTASKGVDSKTNSTIQGAFNTGVSDTKTGATDADNALKKLDNKTQAGTTNVENKLTGLESEVDKFLPKAAQGDLSTGISDIDKGLSTGQTDINSAASGTQGDISKGVGDLSSQTGAVDQSSGKVGSLLGGLLGEFGKRRRRRWAAQALGLSLQ